MPDIAIPEYFERAITDEPGEPLGEPLHCLAARIWFASDVLPLPG